MNNSPCTVCGGDAAAAMDFGDFKVFSCPRCGHEFSGEFTFDHDEIYSPDYFMEDHRNWFENPDLELFALLEAHITEQAAAAGTSGPRVMDIGCGNGNFLNYLSGKGFSNPYGLDILDQEIPGAIYVKSRVEDYEPDETFDAVVSLANIEHIFDVRGYMRTLARLAGPSGIVLVYTVDNASLLYHMAKGFFSLGASFAARRLYDPHHVNHFSAASLNRLAQDAGLVRTRLTRKNIPMNAVDLPKGRAAPVVKAGVAAINGLSAASGLQMLQLAAFVPAGSR